ncbi:hypothetical protein O0I10_007684 [Lichtheimia ornata]|uniref:Glutathione S-transferase 3, mitochondrial n=1 Tax=Lichtheimia ornata TaxID=688661 RepID=A0AAD7UZY9_9FUNG|nr:uncharacterized protein O0I10_007684 [Lichtheimia ornata]KAJ8656607.1 hypothetical protein O0I10_007684 [Lichtheimia ornata]
MVIFTLSQEHGFVLSVLVFSLFQLLAMSLRVGKARKVAGVPYPYVYAEKNEAENEFDKHVFNCIQRVHQNTLEMYPSFAVLLLLGGITHPLINAGAGFYYLVTREVYARGYSTGEPSKRGLGVRTAALGELIMLGTTVHTIYQVFTGST